MSKSTMIRDIKQQVNEKTLSPQQQQQQQQQQQPQQPQPQQHNYKQSEEDLVVNEVLSEIASENKTHNVPSKNTNEQSQHMQEELLQQQLLLQQLQQQLHHQNSQHQQQQQQLELQLNKEQVPYYKKVIDNVQQMFVKDNNLLVKSAVLFLVFQYLDIMSVIFSITKVLKIDKIFSCVENNTVLSNLVKSLLFGVILIIIHPLI